MRLTSALVVGALLVPPLAPSAPAAASAAPAAVVTPVTSATIVHEPWNGLNDLDPWVAAEGPDEVTVTGYPAPDPRQLTFELDVPATDGSVARTHYELEFVLPDGHTFEERRYAWGQRGDPDTDVRPTIYASVRSMGCDAAGEITVHDMAPDLSTLWVTFKLWCSSPDAVSYGEIRVNSPARTVGGLIAPALADWPNAEVGETSEPARWAVQNPTGAPVRLGRPYVTGPDAADFVVGPAECDVVPARGRCPVPLVLTPGGSGSRQATLHVPVVGSGDELSVSLRGTGVGGGYTSIEEYFSAGDIATYWHVGPSAHVYSGNSNYGNGVFVAATDPLTGVRVMPPRGETLEVGRRYTGVVWGGAEPGVGSIGASVISSNDCEDYIAEFTVHELSYGPQGDPASVSLSYDIRCTNWNDEGRDHVQRGAFAWRASEPPPRVEHPPLPEDPVVAPEPEDPSPPPVIEPEAPQHLVLVIRSNRAFYQRGASARLRMWATGSVRGQEVDLRIRRRGHRFVRSVRTTLRPDAATLWTVNVPCNVVVRAKLAEQPWSSARRLVLRVRRPA